MKYDDFSWDNIILEAPGDDADLGDDLSATDYSDAEGLDINEAEPTATADDPADEDPLAEEEGDPADEDPLAEEEGDPADEDPLAEDGEGVSDENPEDEQIDNTESNVVSDKQNINLVNDFIELHKRIDEIMNQIRTTCKTNIRYNPNMLVVRKNMEKLKDLTYDYIVNKFTKESYVSNLYQFNLIIQALNTNIELLSSVMDSNKKFKEQEKGTKKKTDNKKKH